MADDLATQFDRMNIDGLVANAAHQYGVDPDLIHKVIQAESNYNPQATSKAGAQGLMQLMPQTAQEMGITNAYDPAQNINGGVKYLSSMLKRYGGDTAKALAAYNAGPGNVDSGKAFSFPETKAYVEHILGINPQQAPQPTQPTAQQPTKPDLGAQWDAMNPSTPKTDSGWSSWLPSVGGVVGSIAGSFLDAPTAGAAIGGAAGQGYKSLIDNWSQIPGAIKDVLVNKYNEEKQYAQNLAKGNLSGSGPSATDQGFTQGAHQGLLQGGIEAGKQALLEKAGQAIAAPINAVGTSLVKKAFSPTADMLAKNPNIVSDLIDAGINPNAAGESSAQASANTARAAADNAVNQVANGKTTFLGTPSGVSIPAKRVGIGEITDALINNPYGQKSVLDNILEQAEQTPSLNRVGSYIDNVVKDNAPSLNLPDTLALRRREGNLASKVFEGAYENPSLESQLHAATEQGARNGLEIRVPNLANLNDVTQNKMQILEAVQNAIQNRASEAPGHQILRTALTALPGLGVASMDGLIPGILTSLGIHGATELATNPTVQATVGRGLVKTAGVNAPAQVMRLIQGGVAQSNARRNSLTAAQVNALWDRYNQENQNPQQ